MDLPERSPPVVRLKHVIAVVGCDGSGKSMLTADLTAHLKGDRRTTFLYLGQDSGNILDGIRRLPFIGQPLGRYLKRRSERAHASDDRPAAPDLLTALVVHLLSRWRHRKFRRMLALERRGVLVVTDRYPQAEVQGFYFDGPGLGIADASGRIVRWIARREHRLYQGMSRYIPALVIRLNVDAETAHARKPDHKMSMLRDKVRIIPALTFNGATTLDLDGAGRYPETLERALSAIRAAGGARG